MCTLLQVIVDTKGEAGAWSFQTPPSSPSSLGSRKSSMCSISSANSSSGSSAHSPSHNLHNRTLHHQVSVRYYYYFSLLISHKRRKFAVNAKMECENLHILFHP